METIAQVLDIMRHDRSRRLTHAEARALVDETSGRRRSWAPIKSVKECVAKESMASIMARYDGAAHAEQPVSVQVQCVGKAGSEPLAKYASWAEYEAGHNAKAYPPKVVRSVEGTTVVLVRATPWAGRPKPSAGPSTGKGKKSNSKVDLIGSLLLRPDGCTTADVLEATGWPSVSMPAQAKLAGLALRKEKVGKVTKYWGSKVG